MKGIKIYNFKRTNYMKNLVLKNDENIQLKNLANQLSNFARSNSTTNLKSQYNLLLNFHNYYHFYKIL